MRTRRRTGPSGRRELDGVVALWSHLTERNNLDAGRKQVHLSVAEISARRFTADGATLLSYNLSAFRAKALGSSPFSQRRWDLT